MKKIKHFCKEYPNVVFNGEFDLVADLKAKGYM